MGKTNEKMMINLYYQLNGLRNTQNISMALATGDLILKNSHVFNKEPKNTHWRKDSIFSKRRWSWQILISYTAKTLTPKG